MKETQHSTMPAGFFSQDLGGYGQHRQQVLEKEAARMTRQHLFVAINDLFKALQNQTHKPQAERLTSTEIREIVSMVKQLRSQAHDADEILEAVNIVKEMRATLLSKPDQQPDEHKALPMAPGGPGSAGV